MIFFTLLVVALESFFSENLLSEKPKSYFNINFINSLFFFMEEMSLNV